MLSNLFKNDKIQRLVYVLLFCLMSALLYKRLNQITIDELSIFEGAIVATLGLLGTQIILNHRRLWYLVILVFGLYSLWVVWNMIMLDILIEYERDYSPRKIWSFQNVKNWLYTLLILFVINWPLWKIKPQNKQP